MDNLERRLLYRLEEYRNRLLEYCHSDHCEALEKCPLEHKQCKAKLGLNTAIAWTLCRQISQYLTTMYNVQHQPEKEKAPASLLNSAMFALDVTGLHYGEYHLLFNIIHGLLNVVQDCQNFQQEK